MIERIQARPGRLPWIITAAIAAILCLGGSLSSAARAQTQTFSDVAAAAGLTGGAGSWAGVWTDLDGDGDLDLMTLGHLQPALGGKNQLWRNNGDGTFTDITVNAGMISDKIDTHGAIWADFDRDGDPDLYLQNESIAGKPQLYHELWRNNGDGTFTDVAPEAGIIAENHITRGTGAADYDRDGLADIFGVVWENPQSPAFVYELPNLLWHNDGNLVFTNRAAEAGVTMEDGGGRRTMVWTDYDNDGHPDLIVLPPCRLFHNLGDGTFADVTAEAGIAASEQCQGAGFADYDSDGFVDLYTSRGFNVREDDRLYRNNGDGTFSDVTAAAGISNPGLARGVTWGDYDNDGDPDVYVVNFNNATEANRLFRNDGDGTFTDVAVAEGAAAQVAGSGAHGGFTDDNGDGALDIFVTNGEGSAKGPYTLLRNAGNDNAWARIRLIGRVSNPDGLMARVTVDTAASSQMQIHSGPAAWMSQSSMPMHFGLGSETGIDRILIDWPSGIKQAVKNLAVDQTVTLVEGRPIWAEAPTLSAPGFYIWQGAAGSGWKILWMSDGTPRRFSGRITITDGTFSSVLPNRHEGDETVSWTATAIDFTATEAGQFDSLDFFVRGQKPQLTFAVTVDDVADPNAVFIGKHSLRSAALPVVLGP